MKNNTPNTTEPKFKTQITIIIILVILISAAAALFGILSDGGPGEYDYMSIRGENVRIYGKGIYRHMSADVAVQGIGQDYVTLFMSIPLLIIALYLFRKNSIRGQFLLAGALFYFLVTYLFYTAMGMYNIMFLAYASLLGLSFFGFILSLFARDLEVIKNVFPSDRLMRNAGIFVVINSIMVGMLWLQVVLPPLFEGTIYPDQLQHYTTLIVQGFDLGLLLPIGITAGYLAIRKNKYGYIFTTVKLIFLSILMAALTSKIIFMARIGENVIPVIFIMPTVCVISLVFSVMILKRME